MKKTLLAAAAVLFFTAGTAFGLDAAGLIAKIKAKDAKMESEFKDIKIVMESKMTSEGMEMSNTMQIVMKGKKKRSEISMMGMKTIVINDGKDIWMIGAQQGKRKLNDESEAGGNQSAFDWVEDLRAEGAKVTEADVNGKKCYALEGKGKQGNEGKWFVDKTSLSLLKYEGKVKGNMVVIVNSDFKKIKGEFEMPYKMESTMDGKPLMISVVKSVEFNKGVDDGIFNIDSVKQEDLGKMDMEMMMKMMKKK